MNLAYERVQNLFMLILMLTPEVDIIGNKGLKREDLDLDFCHDRRGAKKCHQYFISIFGSLIKAIQ